MPNDNSQCGQERDSSHQRWPGTLLAGLGLIVASAALLGLDLVLRGGAVQPTELLPPPEGPVGWLSRQAAVNMTPLCWVGLLLVLDGLLTLLGRRRPEVEGSPARLRPRRFFLCFLVSIPIWLSFDWINFTFLHAWHYHGLPENIVHRYAGYFFAFGAICPALLLFAQLYRDLGLKRLERPRLVVGPKLELLFFGLGVFFLAYPVAVRNPIGTLTLWLAWFFLLDPMNRRLGAPSLLADWVAGHWGRTLALLTAGATCGFLWEFWNYWAVAKWTYHLPILGPLESYRFFEMPLVGLLGFPFFALECWVMFQTAILVLEKCGIRLNEPLPDDYGVL